MTDHEQPTDDADDTAMTGDRSASVDGDKAAEESRASADGRSNAAAAAASRARRIGGVARTPVRPATGKDAADRSARKATSATEKPADRSVASRAAKAEPVSTRKAASAGSSSTRRPDTGRGAGRSTGSEGRTGSSRQPVDLDARRGRGAWWPAAILSVGVVAMLVVVLATVLRGGSGSGGAERDQVLAAAKSCVVASNSYSYKDIPGFERKGLACGTGTFAVKFKSSVDNIVKKVAPTVKQVQTFQVNTAGIISTSKSQWGILVYGQTHATNVGHPDGETDPFGAVVTMTHKNGRWLMSGLDTLCSSTLSSSGNACV